MNNTHPFSNHSDGRSLGTRPSALTDFCLILLLATVLAACGLQGPVQAAAGRQGATTGASMFDSLGCNSCHRTNGRSSGPSLVGIYGQKIPLDNGVAVTVDDQYIRNAILNPEAQIHAGYQPVMPSFEGANRRGGAIETSELCPFTDRRKVATKIVPTQGLRPC